MIHFDIASLKEKKEQYDELVALIREKIDQKFGLANSRGEETEPAE